MKLLRLYWFEILFLSLCAISAWIYFGKAILEALPKVDSDREPVWMPVQIGGNTYIMPF